MGDLIVEEIVFIKEENYQELKKLLDKKDDYFTGEKINAYYNK